MPSYTLKCSASENKFTEILDGVDQLNLFNKDECESNITMKAWPFET